MDNEGKYLRSLLSYVLRRLEEDEIGEMVSKEDRIDRDELLCDFLSFANDIYEAKVKRGERELKLEFENGQEFLITIEELSSP